MKKWLLFCSWWLMLSGCGNGSGDPYSLVEDWMGREIFFPNHLDFVSLGFDSVKVNMEQDFKVLTYWDAEGCLSCKLQLAEWKQFIRHLDYLNMDNVQVLFFFAPQNKEGLLHELRINRFDYPMNIDENDSLEILNRFPKEVAFQTFLLDKDNKVLAVGNPVLNPKVKELYLKIIQGKPLHEDETGPVPQTTVSVPSAELSLGDFPWQERPTVVFTLKNTGDSPLVIQDAVTSCGCLTVDYTQQPVPPGGEAEVRVTYRADNPGYFDKGIAVYANVAGAPLRLRVRGRAVE